MLKWLSDYSWIFFSVMSTGWNDKVDRTIRIWPFVGKCAVSLIPHIWSLICWKVIQGKEFQNFKKANLSFYFVFTKVVTEPAIWFFTFNNIRKSLKISKIWITIHFASLSIGQTCILKSWRWSIFRLNVEISNSKVC